MTPNPKHKKLKKELQSRRTSHEILFNGCVLIYLISGLFVCLFFGGLFGVFTDFFILLSCLVSLVTDCCVVMMII